MLPKFTQPLTEITIPSLKMAFQFRPMLVREERLMLMAKESKDEKETLKTIKQVISNCVVDEKFNIDSLAIFDIEWVFLQLRRSSVSDVIDQEYIDREDGKTYKLMVDLKQVLPPNVEDALNNRYIILPDGSSLILKFPSADIYGAELTDEQALFECCEAVAMSDGSVIKIDNPDEFSQWFETLPISVSDKITDFFNNLPSMKLDLTYTNTKGSVRTIELRTLSDFFTLR